MVHSIFQASGSISPVADQGLPTEAQVSFEGQVLKDSVSVDFFPHPIPARSLSEEAILRDAEVQTQLSCGPMDSVLFQLDVVPGVNPLQWLAAMLDQHSVQLEARDSVSVDGMPLKRGESISADHGVTGLQAPALQPTFIAEDVSITVGANQTSLVQPHEVEGADLARSKLLKLSEQTVSGSMELPRSPLVVLGEWTGGEEGQFTESATASSSINPLAKSGMPDGFGRSQLVSERGLTLTASQAKWGEQMLHALRETVEMQVQQRFQQATIRLDPPELGSLEILVSHDSGRLNVQISAVQSDVARLLQSTSERLRHELVEQSSMPVNVEVSSDQQSRQHGGKNRDRYYEEEPLGARPDFESTQSTATKTRDIDVLVTV